MASRDDTNRLSGLVLPLVLQKKLKSKRNGVEEGIEQTYKAQDEIATLRLGDASLSLDARANQVFTAEELEERIWKARSAMSDIQKQLVRGEESYHEETNAHGNLFRGWEGFIDARLSDIGTSSQSCTTGASRRMPADSRWFSSSCINAGRNTRPVPLPRKSLSSQLPPTAKATAGVRSSSSLSKPTKTQSSLFSEGQTGRETQPKESNFDETKVADIPKANGQEGVPSADLSSGDGANDGIVQSPLSSGAQEVIHGQDKVNETNPGPASASTPAAVPSAKADSTTGRRTRKRKAGD